MELVALVTSVSSSVAGIGLRTPTWLSDLGLLSMHCRNKVGLLAYGGGGFF